MDRDPDAQPEDLRFAKSRREPGGMSGLVEIGPGFEDVDAEIEALFRGDDPSAAASEEEPT